MLKARDPNNKTTRSHLSLRGKMSMDVIDDDGDILIEEGTTLIGKVKMAEKKELLLEIVKVKINKKSFKLFTQQDGAWSANPELDAKLVKAMKGGNRMVVYGISSRGTKTTDTYSLSGFTAMKKRIDKACK